jgi:hypothetical protein
MNKTALLTLASDDWTFNGVARSYAEQSFSDEQAAERFAAASKASVRWERISLILKWVAFFGVSLPLLGHYLLTQVPSWTSVDRSAMGLAIIAANLLGLIAMMVASVLLSVVKGLIGYKNDIEWLAALARTTNCERALDTLKNGGPNVLAWRDLALQERSQLLMFDLNVMNSLRRVNDTAKNEAAEKARQDAACRALHGLSTAESP